MEHYWKMAEFYDPHFARTFAPSGLGSHIKNHIKRLFIQCSTNNNKLDRDDGDPKGKVSPSDTLQCLGPPLRNVTKSEQT